MTQRLSFKHATSPLISGIPELCPALGGALDAEQDAQAVRDAVADGVALRAMFLKTNALRSLAARMASSSHVVRSAFETDARTWESEPERESWVAAVRFALSDGEGERVSADELRQALAPLLRLPVVAKVLDANDELATARLLLALHVLTNPSVVVRVDKHVLSATRRNAERAGCADTLELMSRDGSVGEQKFARAARSSTEIPELSAPLRAFIAEVGFGAKLSDRTSTGRSDRVLRQSLAECHGVVELVRSADAVQGLLLGLVRSRDEAKAELDALAERGGELAGSAASVLQISEIIDGEEYDPAHARALLGRVLPSAVLEPLVSASDGRMLVRLLLELHAVVSDSVAARKLTETAKRLCGQQLPREEAKQRVLAEGLSTPEARLMRELVQAQGEPRTGVLPERAAAVVPAAEPVVKSPPTEAAPPPPSPAAEPAHGVQPQVTVPELVLRLKGLGQTLRDSKEVNPDELVSVAQELDNVAATVPADDALPALIDLIVQVQAKPTLAANGALLREPAISIGRKSPAGLPRLSNGGAKSQSGIVWLYVKGAAPARDAAGPVAARLFALAAGGVSDLRTLRSELPEIAGTAANLFTALTIVYHRLRDDAERKSLVRAFFVLASDPNQERAKSIREIFAHPDTVDQKVAPIIAPLGGDRPFSDLVVAFRNFLGPLTSESVKERSPWRDALMPYLRLFLEAEKARSPAGSVTIPTRLDEDARMREAARALAAGAAPAPRPAAPVSVPGGTLTLRPDKQSVSGMLYDLMELQYRYRNAPGPVKSPTQLRDALTRVREHAAELPAADFIPMVLDLAACVHAGTDRGSDAILRGALEALVANCRSGTARFTEEKVEVESKLREGRRVMVYAAGEKRSEGGVQVLLEHAFKGTGEMARESLQFVGELVRTPTRLVAMLSAQQVGGDVWIGVVRRSLALLGTDDSARPSERKLVEFALSAARKGTEGSVRALTIDPKEVADLEGGPLQISLATAARRLKVELQSICRDAQALSEDRELARTLLGAEAPVLPAAPPIPAVAEVPPAAPAPHAVPPATRADTDEGLEIVTLRSGGPVLRGPPPTERRPGSSFGAVSPSAAPAAQGGVPTRSVLTSSPAPAPRASPLIPPPNLSVEGVPFERYSVDPYVAHGRRAESAVIGYESPADLYFHTRRLFSALRTEPGSVPARRECIAFLREQFVPAVERIGGSFPAEQVIEHLVDGLAEEQQRGRSRSQELEAAIRDALVALGNSATLETSGLVHATRSIVVGAQTVAYVEADRRGGSQTVSRKAAVVLTDLSRQLTHPHQARLASECVAQLSGELSELGWAFALLLRASPLPDTSMAARWALSMPTVIKRVLDTVYAEGAERRDISRSPEPSLWGLLAGHRQNLLFEHPDSPARKWADRVFEAATRNLPQDLLQGLIGAVGLDAEQVPEGGGAQEKLRHEILLPLVRGCKRIRDLCEWFAANGTAAERRGATQLLAVWQSGPK